MDAKTTEIVAAYELPKGDVETALSFAEAVAEANAAGVSNENMLTVSNPYESLNQDKSALLDTAFIIRHVKFQEDAMTKNPYLNMWVITEGNKHYRVTDGSTGIYKQMSALVAKRLEDGHPTPYNYFAVPGGLRSSDFGLDKDGKSVKAGDPSAVSKARTYYLA